MSSTCSRVLKALEDCQKKHPYDGQYVCTHLTKAAGWCIFAYLCPTEVRGIEDCIGIPSSLGKAPILPARCAHKGVLLEACLEAQQALAEQRTTSCGGARPYKKGADASAIPGGAA